MTPLNWLINKLLTLYLALLCVHFLSAQNNAVFIQEQIDAARERLLSDSFYSPSYRMLAPLKYQISSVPDSFAQKKQLQFELYSTYLEVVNGMIASTINPEGKKLAYQREFRVFEQGIRVATQLFQTTNDSIYLEWAFGIAEQNRNLLLSNNLYTPFELPDSLEGELGRLLSAINITKSKIEEATRQKHAELRIAFENSRDSLKDLYNQKLSRFQAPLDFLALQSSPVLLNISEIQSALLPDEAFLEFFCGRDSVFVFVITAHSKTIQKLCSTQELASQVSNFHQFIFNRKELWQKASMRLFQLLIQPIEEHFRSCSKLIIVPDGLLSSLPFSALCRPLDEWDRSFKSLDFLVFDYEIHFQHAAKAFLGTSKNTIYDPQVFALAPVFSASMQKASDSLSHQIHPLPQTPALLRSIDSSFDGIYLSKEQANAKAFHQYFPQCDILHLSTHTFLHPSIPMYTQIRLAPNEQSKDYIQLHELFPLAGKINCDLAVLGSCHSGSGPHEQGESLSGLAYGFSYLGVRSIIYSLWAVDEQATNQLLRHFYQQLAKGTTKASSLRQAQIHYIQNANEESASPFFWAGFVLNGQNQPYLFQRQNPTNQWWWFAGLLISLLTTLYISMRFFSKK